MDRQTVDCRALSYLCSGSGMYWIYYTTYTRSINTNSPLDGLPEAQPEVNDLAVFCLNVV